MRPLLFAAAFVCALAWPRAEAPVHQSGSVDGDTYTLVCGADRKLPGVPYPLRWSTVVLAGDSRLYVACPEGIHSGFDYEAVHGSAIREGLRSTLPEVRWRAIQATVRLSRSPAMIGELKNVPAVIPGCSARIQVIGGIQDQRRWQPGQLFRFILDFSADIRAEAAYALGARLSADDLNAELVKSAAEELRACFVSEEDARIQGLLLEDLGLARYGNDEDRTAAESFLVQQAHGEAPRILGAMRGLQALLKQNPQRPLRPATLERLRQLVVMSVESNDPRIRLLALLALQTAGDTDTFTMREVARDPDWQVRRVLAGRLNLLNAEQARLAISLENDEAFQVRYELLAPQSRLATNTGICAPIIRRLKDPILIVQLQAMDSLVAKCTDLEDILPKLIDLAASLELPESHQQWYLPARALSALARIKPDEAKKRIAPAIKHPVWQVRAAVASASVSLQDDAVALTLVNDPEPNVRTAVLDALFRLKSPSLVPEALKVLKLADDFQLLRMAAYVLKGVKEEAKPDATEALLFALQRATATGMDTSRDTRVAIIDRLTETMTPDRTGSLFPYLSDIDDEVIAATTRVFAALLPTPPPAFPLSRRYPFQPKEDEIAALPATARITLQEGTVDLELLRDVAPVTVARFAMLVKQGYYNGLTFHHVVPNFMVQGGSPKANDFSSVQRFMRDEIGPQARHERGAVAMSGQGSDAGDGQFFVELIDQPSFDRVYTVFAKVKSGMNLIDRLLDGAKIVGVTVK